MSDQPKKCACPACNCIPPEGKKYCSTYCEDARKLTLLQCECNHPGCAANKL